MSAQPRLGMLAFLDIPVDCRMSGEVNEDGDVRFTVGGSHDEFGIVFEPAALEPFLRLGFDLLCEAARVNPRALATGDGLREGAPFAFGAEALRKLATLCDKADAAASAVQAATAARPAADLVVAAGAIP